MTVSYFVTNDAKLAQCFVNSTQARISAVGALELPSIKNENAAHFDICQHKNNGWYFVKFFDAVGNAVGYLAETKAEYMSSKIDWTKPLEFDGKPVRYVGTFKSGYSASHILAIAIDKYEQIIYANKDGLVSWGRYVINTPEKLKAWIVFKDYVPYYVFENEEQAQQYIEMKTDSGPYHIKYVEFDK